MSVNKEFKVLSALGMIFVLCGHFDSSAFSFGGIFVYDSFHMPLFIFISGYFFKEKYVETFKSLFGFVKKKVIHLLVPYYIWNMVYFMFAYIIQRYTAFSIMNGEITIKRLLISPFQIADGAVYNVASWFLMALFICQVVYILIRYILSKLLKKYIDFVLLIAFFAISIVSIRISQSAWDNEWKITLCRTAYILFYYELGYFFGKYIEKYNSRINPIVSLLVCVTAKIILMNRLGNSKPIVYTMEFGCEISSFLYVLYAVLGIYFWLCIAKILTPALGDNKWVLYYSNHTFSLMMHQGLVGLILNGALIKSLHRYDLVDAYLSQIWINVLGEPFSLLLPILISVVIVAILKIYDYVSVLFRNRIIVKIHSE